MASIVEDFPFKHVSNRHRNIPKNSKARPWPISPNITPNKNGKVTHVKNVGLTSLYIGIPYVLTIS